MQAVGNIKIGGNVVGSAVAAGSCNIQTVTFSGSDAAERERVLDALQAIQFALNELKGAPAKSAQREAAAAVEAAKEQGANKDDIGSALETALGAAKKADEFVSIAGTLLPHIQTVATWLGTQWAGLVAPLI
jgi:hypothetical protein